MRITIEQLLESGYKKFPTQSALKPQPCDGYSKTFYEGTAKLYFVHFYDYIHPKFEDGHALAVEARFYTDAYFCFEINLHWLKEKSLEEVELFFEKAYMVFGCIPDPHNN